MSEESAAENRIIPLLESPPAYLDIINASKEEEAAAYRSLLWKTGLRGAARTLFLGSYGIAALAVATFAAMHGGAIVFALKVPAGTSGIISTLFTTATMAKTFTVLSLASTYIVGLGVTIRAGIEALTSVKTLSQLKKIHAERQKSLELEGDKTQTVDKGKKLALERQLYANHVINKRIEEIYPNPESKAERNALKSRLITRVMEDKEFFQKAFEDKNLSNNHFKVECKQLLNSCMADTLPYRELKMTSPNLSDRVLQIGLLGWDKFVTYKGSRGRSSGSGISYSGGGSSSWDFGGSWGGGGNADPGAALMVIGGIVLGAMAVIAAAVTYAVVAGSTLAPLYLVTRGFEAATGTHAKVDGPMTHSGKDYVEHRERVAGEKKQLEVREANKQVTQYAERFEYAKKEVQELSDPAAASQKKQRRAGMVIGQAGQVVTPRDSLPKVSNPDRSSWSK